MMNLVSMRESAERRQQLAHQNRAFHRERQKECEREDQALKKVVRSIDVLLAAQAGFGAVLKDVSPELLVAIGASEPLQPVAEIEPAPAPVAAEPEPVETADEAHPEPEVAKPLSVAATPAISVTDNDVLLIMRANRRPDGICLLRPSAIAEQAGMHVGALNVGPLRRLAAAGLIKRTTEGRYIVQGKATETRAAPIKQEPTRLPATSQTTALELRLLDHLRRAADPVTGDVLIERAFLAKKLATTDVRLDDALVGLVASGHAIRRANPPKGHLAIKVLTKAEAAAE